MNNTICGISNCIVIGESGYIALSSDLTNWTNINIPISKNLNGLTFLNGQFIVVGDNGVIFTAFDNSYDALNWNSITPITSNNLNNVKCTNVGCVAIGNNGTILYSVNGSIWNAQNSGTPNNLYSVSYANGIYTVVGANNTILTSSNGINWTLQPSVFNQFSMIDLFAVISY